MRLVLGLLAVTMLVIAPAAAAPLPKIGQTVTGRIAGYECGDNCYLTIKPAKGAAIVGLCVARQCAPWNDKVQLPRRLMGARVTVTIGVGHQYDGSGTDMGEFTSFTAIAGLPK